MNVNMTIRAAVAAVSVVVCAGAQAVVVNVPAGTLYTVPSGSTSHTYLGLDADGTSMHAQASPGGRFDPINSGDFYGLWFGSNHQSATYTFSFSAPISYFDFRVNAMSTLGDNAETIGNFTLDTAATPSFTFTNIQYTAWDGSTVTSGPQDNGEFILTISVGPGQSFSSVSFDHFQVGRPSGSVVRQINYELAPVPEPANVALMLLGFAVLAGVARRRR